MAVGLRKWTFFFFQDPARLSRHLLFYGWAVKCIKIRKNAFTLDYILPHHFYTDRGKKRQARKKAWIPSRAIVKHYRALLSMLDNSGNSFRSLLWSLIPRWRFGSLSFDLTDHKVMPLERQSMIPPYSNVTLSTFWYFLKLVGSNFLGGVPSKEKDMGHIFSCFLQTKVPKICEF